MKQTVICIAGAHRSGTSMVTRLLHVCGLELGPERDLMPARPDNPDGFWENLRFVAVNDQVLNTTGAAWDLPPAEEEDFGGSGIEGAETKARILAAGFDAEPAWGWKDPRNCLTLPFWRRVIPELRILIVVRNPLEVAYSMHRRNGTSYALGLRLWEIYNRRILAHAAPEERLITSYQTFFERPQEELQRLTSFAGLGTKAIEAAAALIAKDHRHTSFTIEQLIDAGADEEVVALYRRLVAAAIPQEPGARKKKARAGELGGSAKRISEMEDPLAGASSSINFSILESETVRRELAQRRGAEIEYAGKTRQLEARIDALTRELSGNAQRTALEIGRRDGRITELQEAFAHLNELLLREQAGRDKLLVQLAELRERSHEEVRQVQSRADRLALEVDELRKRFAETNHHLHSYSIRLEEREKENLSLVERLRKQLQVTKRLDRLLEETARASERLHKSRRWILANFFGWLIAKLSRRQPPGFGHLDRTVEKYHTWRKANPEIEYLDDAIAALRLRQSPAAPLSADSHEPDQVNQGSVPPSPVPAPPTAPIQFPDHATVDVSIIIPVFNQIGFTQACLSSIQKHAGSIPFQVIVVDDCSTDSTRECISSLPGVKYLRSDSNQGFVAACNRGAKAARGEYLVFLNNDTQVTHGWLEALLETFQFEPDAGLVGSKLTYPDGRLQEAGGIIWRDATGWNRGKFQDSRDPEYNYLREVDYCSGASIMIPQALFAELGGFDQRYAPAYYEDTDLAFKVTQAGRKVLYQPLSVVLHYEGATGGTDTSVGPKKHQEINRASFAKKWHDRLQRQPINGELTVWDSSVEGRHRILVIDHHLPMADRDSGSLRMFHILVLLRQLGHRVTFLPDNLCDIPPYGDRLRARGIKILHHPYVTSIREYLQSHGADFDLIVLSRCDFAQKHVYHARTHAPNARLIFDTVDLHFLREQRQAAVLGDASIMAQATEHERLEYELIDQTDETWVVSPQEQSLLRAARPTKSIQVVSNIVEVPGSATPFSERQDILFIGSFQHPPNVDAVLFFARQILPLIRKAIPDFYFYVIGDKAPHEIIALSDERTKITGFQPDVDVFFDSVKISIAPLRYGAGVKGKINQSMGFGVPVVATSLAVEGMGLRNRKDVMIADSPEGFARALVELYTSAELWERISQAGIEKTRALYSPTSAKERLRRLLAESRASVTREVDEATVGASFASV